ncbi:MAG: hypothetical protein AAGG45_06235, partial [Pseudomonadota bacterium]
MRVFLTLVSFAMIALLASAFAQKPALEDYARQLTYSAAALSPDGSKIAVLTRIDGQVSLMVYAVSGRVVLQAPIQDIKARAVQFVGNDYVVLRASETTRVLGFRSEFENSGAIAVNLKTKKAALLLNKTDDIFPAQSGLGDILGRGKADNTVLMRAFMGMRYTDNPPNNLLTVNLDTGRASKLRNGRNSTLQWIADGQGDALARIDYDNRTNEFSVRKRDGNGWETIYKYTSEIPPFYVSGILPDKSGLVFIDSRDDEDGFDQFMVLDLNGDISGPVFAPRDREIGNVYYDRNGALLGVRYITEQVEEYEFLDQRLQSSFDAVNEVFLGSTVSLIDWSDDRSSILYRVYADSLGHYYILHKPATNEIEYFANLSPNIPKTEIASIYSISYDARDGLRIPAMLRVPRGVDLRSKPRLPAIMMP